MNKNDQYLTLPVLYEKPAGYSYVGSSLFLAVFFLCLSFLAYQEEPGALLITVPGTVISLYIGIRWWLLCIRKLRLTPNELQVWQLGKCIQVIPAGSLRLACTVTGTKRQGKHSGRRLHRLLAISRKSMAELAEIQKENMLNAPDSALEAKARSAKAGWEEDFAARYLTKRMKFRRPIDGVWTSCYPELVAALRYCYPQMQWDRVSKVSLKKNKITDNDPYSFLRYGTQSNSSVIVMLTAMVLVMGVFAFMGVYREGNIKAAVIIGVIVIVFVAALVIAQGVERSLISLSRQGIQVNKNRKIKEYPAKDLHTAVVFTELDYREGEYQVIVFSTLSAGEIAAKQENRIRKRPGGEKKLHQWKKIPGWEKRLVYRYCRKVMKNGGLFSRDSDYMLHSDQREQTLRELYPHLQWIQMTEKFEVIL